MDLIFIVAKGNGEPGIFLHLGDYEGNQAIRHRFYDTWYGTGAEDGPFLEDLLRTLCQSPAEDGVDASGFFPLPAYLHADRRGQP